MEYYSAIEKNTFESVLMRWMKLEPIIQSEVSQKEKHQYSILTHIYTEFRKMVTITLYTRQQKRHRDKEQTFGLKEIDDIQSQGAKLTLVDYRKISYAYSRRDLPEYFAELLEIGRAHV